MTAHMPSPLKLHDAERPLVLTLDVGTSSVRSLLFDARGRHIEGLGAQIHHSPDTTSDGGYTFDADALLDRCLAAISAFLEQTDVTPDAVAVDTFWHSLVGVDKRGQAVTPVYLWADTRSRDYVPVLRDLLDEKAVHARTGCLFHTSYLPVRLLWLQREHGDLFRQVDRWLSFAEYMWLKLFGVAAGSHSMVSGSGLFNLNELQWDEEVLQALGLTPENLGDIVDVSEPFTHLRTWPGANLARLAGVPWFPGLGDGACSNVGAGCITPETPAIMIGTSGAMRTIWQVESLSPPWGLWAYRVDAERFVMGGALSNGGNLIAWLTQTLQLDRLSEYEEELLKARPAEHGLTLLPFWAGERSPGWASDATGAIVGLRLHTSPAHIVQAAMEAVAYRFSLIFERLVSTVARVDSLVATGGGLLKNRAWRQIVSDVLNRPLVVSLEPEASSRGAALVALRALGTWETLADVPGALGETCEPRPDYHAAHMEARERHVALYDQLIPTGNAT